MDAQTIRRTGEQILGDQLVKLCEKSGLGNPPGFEDEIKVKLSLYSAETGKSFFLDKECRMSLSKLPIASLMGPLRIMQKGEVSWVYSAAKYTFGAAGACTYGVPPNTDVFFKIEVVDIIRNIMFLAEIDVKKTKAERSYLKDQAIILKHIEEVNQMEHSQLRQKLRLYRLIYEKLRDIQIKESEVQFVTDRNILMSTVLMNGAKAAFQLGMPDKTIKMAEDILAYAPRSHELYHQAYYIMACAHHSEGRLKPAIGCIQRAVFKHPTSPLYLAKQAEIKGYRDLLAEVDEFLAEYTRQEDGDTKLGNFAPDPFDMAAMIEQGIRDKMKDIREEVYRRLEEELTYIGAEVTIQGGFPEDFLHEVTAKYRADPAFYVNHNTSLRSVVIRRRYFFR